MRRLLIVVFSVMFAVHSKADNCVSVNQWEYDPPEVDVMIVQGFFISSDGPNKNGFKLFVNPGNQLCAKVPAGTLVKGEKDIRCKTKLRGSSAMIDFQGKSVVVCGKIDVNAVAERSAPRRAPSNCPPSIDDAVDVPVNKASAKQGPGSWPGPYGADKAVDNKHGGNWYTDRCATTMRGANPWWQVDLAQPSWVVGVTVQDRTDAPFHLRLKDFKVYVDGKLCLHYPGNFPDRETLACNKPVFGTTIKVTKPDPDHLQICDLVVKGSPGGSASDSTACSKPGHGTPPSLADSKAVALRVASARQGPGSWPGPYGADKAVDNKHGGNWYTDRCATTMRGANPWWEVDFVKPQWVTAVEIQDRIDRPFHLRLKNFRILVDGKQCAHYPGNFPDRKTVKCDKPVFGKTLRITKPDPDHLQLCDVIVKGG